MAAIDDKKREYLAQLDKSEQMLSFAIRCGENIGQDVSTLKTALNDLRAEILVQKAAIAS